MGSDCLYPKVVMTDLAFYVREVGGPAITPKAVARLAGWMHDCGRTQSRWQCFAELAAGTDS